MKGFQMAHIDNRFSKTAALTAFDEDLRAYMPQVYTYMAMGVAVSGVVAYLIFTFSVTDDPTLAAEAGTALRRGMYLTPFAYRLFATPLMWLIALAPIGFVIFLSWRIDRMSIGAAQVAFWLFAIAMGASLSTIFLRYTAMSIAQVFFVTAAAFAALSFVGYTTNKDLSGWGAFLIMGVVGIVIAALVSIFLQSSALQFAIAVIGVLIFAALTAYDTQRIKENYRTVAGDVAIKRKAAILGALSLYLDFINVFTLLAQLLGNRN
jgi:uncharacterized protein